VNEMFGTPLVILPVAATATPVASRFLWVRRSWLTGPVAAAVRDGGN
jgi:hypothetical protein